MAKLGTLAKSEDLQLSFHAAPNMVTIGIDLGDHYGHCCLLGSDGVVLTEGRVRSTPEAMASHFKDLPPSRIAIEVGAHSRWVSQLFQEWGHEVIVANPRNLPMITSNIRKSDKVDAHLLARLARVDPQLLSPVTHRGKAHYPAIAQLRARDLLVRARTRLINAVRGISKTVGLRIPTCSSPSFPEKATSCLSEELKPSLAPLLETISHLSKQIYCNTVPLADNHRHALDGVLANREGSKISILTWLRQPPGAPKPKHILVHLERLKTLRKLLLPDGLEHIVHQNRLLKLAREGGQMTAQHLGDLELERRHATLVAMLLDTRATLIDEIIDQHDRFMGTQFSKAKRNHADRFQQSGKAINDKVRLYSRIGRALLDAKQSGADSVCRHRSDHPLGGVQQKHH